MDGAVNCLGVHSDLAHTFHTQLELSKAEIRKLLAAYRFKLASPDTLKVVVESCIANMVAYKGALSGWTLRHTAVFIKLLAAEYRRRTLNNRTS